MSYFELLCNHMTLDHGMLGWTEMQDFAEKYKIKTKLILASTGKHNLANWSTHNMKDLTSTW